MIESKFISVTKRARFDELSKIILRGNDQAIALRDQSEFREDEFIHIVIDGDAVTSLHTFSPEHMFLNEYQFSRRVKALTLRNVNKMHTYGLFRHLPNLESLVIDRCNVPIVISDSFCPLIQSIHIIESWYVHMHAKNESFGFDRLESFIVEPKAEWNSVKHANMLFVEESRIRHALDLWKQNKRCDIKEVFKTDQMSVLGRLMSKLPLETENNIRGWIGYIPRTIVW
jgi:hypothetical protein